MLRTLLSSVALLAITVLLLGCHKPQHDQNAKSVTSSASKVAVAQMMPSRAATTQPVNNNVRGTVTFYEMPDGKVKIAADITGLTPNTKHGFHIHEKGDLSAPDLMSTGGHYNPDHHIHGGPTTSPVHAGDFGNLNSDGMGHATLELTVDDISIGGAKNDVIGKAIMIHAKMDDLQSQPAGNAGPRVAGGIIELQK